MKIYTKKGDTGMTALIGGEKRSKSDPIFSVLGDLDELNANLGLAASVSPDLEQRRFVHSLQGAILGLGAALAGSDQRQQVSGLDALIQTMESQIDEWTEELEPLRNFVLPGGTHAAATLHVARTVCRRVERSLVEQNARSCVPAVSLVFINRLSDWLFCAARAANRREDAQDIVWKGHTEP